jgi:hypothetical protein
MYIFFTLAISSANLPAGSGRNGNLNQNQLENID